jgi:hypothetical protein
MPSFVTTTESPLTPEQTFDRIVDLSQWTTFRGYGPLPGIVRAELAEGPLGPGARVRVLNTDGSTHHEVFEVFERGKRLHIRMELQPPASRVLARIDERVELEPSASAGTSMTRSFELTPRSLWTTPLAWGVAALLRRAVLLHNRAAF